MSKRLRRHTALGLIAAAMFGASLATNAQTSDQRIVAGQRAGPIRVGMLLDEVTRLLGQPERVEKNPPFQKLYFERLGLTVRLQSAVPNVYTIDVSNPAYVTDKGIRVGSSMFDVVRAYGSNYVEVPGREPDLFYKSLGLTVTISNQRVKTISVFRPQ